MAGKDRVTKASVQFEFYRILKNHLDAHYSSSIEYESIQPEYSVRNRAVDLVIDAKIGHVIMHFLAIEVKKPTIRSFLLFDRKSTQQIEDYAKTLDSVYARAIVSLGRTLDPIFWEHVKRDIPHHYFFAFDWKYNRAKTEILLALRAQLVLKFFQTQRVGGMSIGNAQALDECD